MQDRTGRKCARRAKGSLSRVVTIFVDPLVIAATITLSRLGRVGQSLAKHQLVWLTRRRQGGVMVPLH